MADVDDLRLSNNTFADRELVKLSLDFSSFIQLSAQNTGWADSFWLDAKRRSESLLIER